MALDITFKVNEKNKKVMAQISNARRSTEEGIRKAFYLIGKDLTKSARQSIIKGPKTGRVYRILINKRLRNHRASAPGEAPANFRGNLQKSIGFSIKGNNDMEFGAGGTQENVKAKGKDVDYAKFLEVGTTRMKKRPFLIRAINKLNKNTENYFSKAIEKELKKK